MMMMICCVVWNLFEGVKSVKFNENDPEELWVTGKVDPEELRKKLEQKMTKRKVELIISPLPQKKAGKNKGGSGGGGGERKNQEKPAKEVHCSSLSCVACVVLSRYISSPFCSASFHCASGAR